MKVKHSKSWGENAAREQAAARAEQLLCHYFRLVAEAAGVQWDSDNESEVREIVRSTLAAAKGNSNDY